MIIHNVDCLSGEYLVGYDTEDWMDWIDRDMLADGSM